RSHAVARSSSRSRGVTIVPFYEYIKRYRVSSRTFESFEEFLIGCMQKLKGQRRGHFVLKTPTSPPVFVRAPRVETPFVSLRRVSEALDRVFARPAYATPVQIESEELARRQRFIAIPEQRRIGVAHAAKRISYRRKKND